MAEPDHAVTDLVIVNYDKLRLTDATETANLYSACAELGFFFLELGDRMEVMLQTVDELFGVTKEYFAKSLEEKLKDTRTETDVFHICGYAFDQNLIDNYCASSLISSLLQRQASWHR
jgi:isopenicillin N synthase-like dioxygenase